VLEVFWDWPGLKALIAEESKFVDHNPRKIASA
jgi:hypothetical protein